MRYLAGPASDMGDGSGEATLNLRLGQGLRQAMQEAQHHLVILQPESAVRRVAWPPGH